MTAPVKLALIGKVRFGEVPEGKAARSSGMTWCARPACRSRFANAWRPSRRDGDGFVVRTNRGTYRTRSVLLTMGRRGTPRKLERARRGVAQGGVPTDRPDQYAGQAVLVVGGGDSALEAAARAGRAAGHRRSRCRTAARPSRASSRRTAWRWRQAQRARRVRVELESTVQAIEPDSVQLQTTGGASDAAQRGRHRLRRRPAADPVAAEDRHPLRDQARLCVSRTKGPE